MSQLYDKMVEGTLLVVLCQSALTSMVNLMAKRTKSRWDANSKERLDTVAGRKRDRAQSKCPPPPALYHVAQLGSIFLVPSSWCSLTNAVCNAAHAREEFVFTD